MILWYYDAASEALDQVAQRCGRCPIPGSIQAQVEQVSEQSYIVEDVPAHSRGGWKQMIFEGLFQHKPFYDSMILWTIVSWWWYYIFSHCIDTGRLSKLQHLTLCILLFLLIWFKKKSKIHGTNMVYWNDSCLSTAWHLLVRSDSRAIIYLLEHK